MSPRTILYLHSSAGRYGADRQLQAIVTGLDPRRYRAVVALPSDGELAGDLRAAGIEVLVRPLAVLRRSIMSPRGISRVAAAWAADAGGLARVARARGVALVHTNTSVTLGGAAVSRLVGVPHVWHVREIYAGFERWFPAYRRLLLSADALPCVSRAACTQFDGAPAAFVLHDGLPYPPQPVPREEARAALGLPADAFVVAVLGRISGWKGQDVLVRALADLPEDAVALICGSPWAGEERHLRELRELATTLGVGDRTSLMGTLDRPSLAYGAADVVVVPSKQPDPFPNSALEAAAHGCCVVGADHGGIPEIIEDGTTGLLVPPNDATALARSLGALREAPDRRRTLGEAAAKRARTEFATPRLSDAIHALYDRLLG